MPLALPCRHHAVLAERGRQRGQLPPGWCRAACDRRARRSRSSRAPTAPQRARSPARTRPASRAFCAALWLRSAYSSCCSRVMLEPGRRASRRSAPCRARSGCRAAPTMSESSSLHPGPSLNPRRAPRITCGAWLMFSVPPASITHRSRSELDLLGGADHRLDPRTAKPIDGERGHGHRHPRLQADVPRAVDARRPLVCMTLPKMTWSIFGPGRQPAAGPGLPSTATAAPRSSALTRPSAPPGRPSPVFDPSVFGHRGACPVHHV